MTYKIKNILISLFLMSLSSVLFAAVSVSISPAGGFNITPGIAVVDQSVGTITIDSTAGYDVTLKDDNSGNLKNGVNNLPYTVKYNAGSEITLSTTPVSVETGPSVTAGSRSLTVFIAAGISVGLPAGAYTASITVEILAI